MAFIRCILNLRWLIRSVRLTRAGYVMTLQSRLAWSKRKDRLQVTTSLLSGWLVLQRCMQSETRGHLIYFEVLRRRDFFGIRISLGFTCSRQLPIFFQMTQAASDISIIDKANWKNKRDFNFKNCITESERTHFALTFRYPFNEHSILSVWPSWRRNFINSHLVKDIGCIQRYYYLVLLRRVCLPFANPSDINWMCFRVRNYIDNPPPISSVYRPSIMAEHPKQRLRRS